MPEKLYLYNNNDVMDLYEYDCILKEKAQNFCIIIITIKNIKLPLNQIKTNHIYPTPPLGLDMTQSQFFKWTLTGLNSEFSFS